MQEWVFSWNTYTFYSEVYLWYHDALFFQIVLSFFIEVQLICNVVLVSGVQKSDSVIHTYIFIFQSLFTCKLLQNWVEFPVLFSRPLLVIYFIYSSGKEHECQRRRHKRQGFDPWVRKIPWSRAWQLTPVILAWRIPWTRSLAGHRVAKSQTRLKQLNNGLHILCLK